jgi:hypothetical protein
MQNCIYEVKNVSKVKGFLCAFTNLSFKAKLEFHIAPASCALHSYRTYIG